MIITTLLAFLVLRVSAQPPFGPPPGLFGGDGPPPLLANILGGGGRGPPAQALQKLFRICGDEPPVACECRNFNREDDDNDDDDDNVSEDTDLEDFSGEDPAPGQVQLVEGELPGCLPSKCVCKDGTEKTLPFLPRPIAKKLQKILGKLASKPLAKLNTLCNGNTAPDRCECNKGPLESVSFPVTDPIQILKCKPSRCLCIAQAENGDDEWLQIHPGRFIANQLLTAICRKEEVSPLLLSEAESKPPTSCVCEDGSVLEAPFKIRALKDCQPQTCSCPGGDEGEESRTVEVDFSNMKKRLRFFRRKFDKLSKLCPEDSAPESCSCDNDPEMTISPPFDNPLDVLACLPNTCTCQDGSSVQLKKPKPFMKLKEMCDGDRPDSCTCQDGEVMVLQDPEQLRSQGPMAMKSRIRKMFKECKPVKCQCPDGEEKILTMFGCKEGGVPGCQDEEEQGRRRWKGPKLVCSNGDRVKVLKAVLAELKRTCICEDGIAPTCPEGGPPTCPDGSAPDKSLAQVPDFLSQCSTPTSIST